MNISILGAGAMGAALTVPFADGGHTVTLWCTEHDGEAYQALSAGGPHPKLKAGLPEVVRVFHQDELKEALRGAELVVLGVSTPGVLPVLKRMRSITSEIPPILTVAKGFMLFDERPYPLPSAIRRELGNRMSGTVPSLLSLAGPSIAGELVRRRPTAAAISGHMPGGLRGLCKALATDYFWIDPVEDMKGLEMCLAYKNIYSIALAWPGGLEGVHEELDSRNNLTAILMIQIVDELSHLVKGHGGDPGTVGGWAGLGDLIATSGGGRNGRFGHLLASGCSTEKALDILEKEGVRTVEGYLALARGVTCARELFGCGWAGELPLLDAVQRVIEGNTTVRWVVGNIQRIRETNQERSRGT